MNSPNSPPSIVPLALLVINYRPHPSIIFRLAEYPIYIIEIIRWYIKLTTKIITQNMFQYCFKPIQMVYQMQYPNQLECIACMQHRKLGATLP